MADAQRDRPVGAALVVGGGIGGMQAALDLAAAGIKVYLAEQKTSIGGVMAQLDKTFPTNDCAMCTQAPRLVAIGRHPDVEVITLSDVERLEGTAGDFRVTLVKRPRYVDEAKCTGCGTCTTMCPTRNVIQLREPVVADLDAERKAKIDAIVARHGTRAGPLMPILQEINAAFNYFPEDVLTYVSERTGYPLTHIYRVATFYGAFSLTPRGRHIISVCMGTTCYVRRSERLMEKFGEVLGIAPDETTPDMAFTLKPVRCIGCCGLAPAVVVGQSVHGKLTPRDVPAIVDKYRTDA